MHQVLCLFNPVACAATSVAKATLGDVFDALTGWILASVQWFIDASAHVLTSASDPTLVVHSATLEYSTLLTIAAPLMLIGLLVATVTALRHGDAGSLWRVYLGVAPGAVLVLVVARPVALLILRAVDQLSSGAAVGVAQHERIVATSLMALTPTVPGFGLFVLAVGVVLGTWLLWCELILRTVVLTLLLVLVPVVVPLTTFPALRRMAARLAETFIAVAASKFLIVVTLTLGLNELTGSTVTQVITGAVTLILAAGAPFLLLRVVPFIEQSALHNLEGVRSRLTRSATGVLNSPVVAAGRALLPDVPIPGPPERPADLGFEMWESSPMPDVLGPLGPDEAPLPAPVGTPTLRGGHVAYRKDHAGPVVGWHFDE